MDPARRAFYRFHASLMEPWDGPAARRVHRRHASSARSSTATACAPAAGGTPRTTWSCWPARPACSTSTRRRRRRQGPAAAGPDVPGRHRRRAGSSPTRRSRARWPPSTRTTTGCTPAWCTSTQLPERAPRRVPSHESVRPPAAGSSATPRRSCASWSTPMAAHRRRADRLDGHRHPDRGAVGPVRGCSTTTSASCSRR